MFRRLYLPVLVSLGGAALAALLVFGVLALGGSRTLDEAVAQGKYPLAPGYARRLPRLYGPGTGSLAQYRGRVVLLNLWASWCPPCQHEAPLVELAQQALRRDGATVLGVSYKDTVADSRRFMAHERLSYPDLRDVNGSFAEGFGTQALPESFLIDREGRIVRISRGEIDRGFVQAAEALAREP